MLIALGLGMAASLEQRPSARGETGLTFVLPTDRHRLNHKRTSSAGIAWFWISRIWTSLYNQYLHSKQRVDHPTADGR